MCVCVAPEPIIIDVVDIVAERFGEELVRRGHVLVGVAKQDGGAEAMGGASGFGCECGLAETGLAAQEHDLSSFPIRNTLVCIGEHSRLDLATYHSNSWANGEACLQRDDPTGLGHAERLPDHFDGGDGIWEAPQGHRAHRSADMSVSPSRHQRHDGGSQDLTAFTDIAETGCLDHRVPVEITVLGCDFPTTQPDPQSHAVPTITIGALDALLHGDGTGQCGRSGGERHHDSVAQSLDLVATIFGRGLTHDREIAAAHLVGGFGRHADRQCGRSDHVTEENRHVLGGHAPPPGAPRRTGALATAR